MSETWKQERPPWCPHPTCGYRASSQALVCMGELPAPEAHGEGMNTHRICLHGAKDDGEWTFDLQINKGDGYAIWRLLKGLFGFGQGTLAALPNKTNTRRDG